MKTHRYFGITITDMRGEFYRGSWDAKAMDWQSLPAHWWVLVGPNYKDFPTKKAAMEYVKKNRKHLQAE